MTEIAHPFVVARNRTLDWRALVAPQELIDANEDYALVLQTGKEHPAPVTVQQWEDHSGRPWVLCYRSVPAEPGFVGEQRPGPLTDRFGRELFIVEGVVLRGSAEPSPARARELIDRMHDDAVEAFRVFWPEEDEGVLPTASAPLGAAPRTAVPDTTDREQPRARGWSSLLTGRGLVVAGGILAVVLALAWITARAFGVGGTGG